MRETSTPRTTVISTPLTTSTSTQTITQLESTVSTAPAITVTSSAGMAKVKRHLNMAPILKLFAGPIVSEACSVIIGTSVPRTTTTLVSTATRYISTSTISSINTAKPTVVTRTLDTVTKLTTQIEQAPVVTDTDTASEETVYESTTTIQTITSTIIVQPTITVSPLPGPPPVLSGGATLWNSRGPVDDEAQRIALPFAMTLYGESSSSIWVSSNGLLGLGSAHSYCSNYAFPRDALSDGALIALFWDDLYIYPGTTQNIYYKTDGRTVTIECLVSRFNHSERIYHFSAFYDSAVPGVIQVRYYEASDGVDGATIGMQNGARSLFQNYSDNQAVITPGTLLTFNTNANTITAGKF